MKAVTTLGGMHTFDCRSINNDVQQYQWLVNGTELQELNLTDGVIMTEDNDVIAFISFNNITMKYNGTTIQCIANLTSGEIIPSNNATLLVQGESIIIFIDHAIFIIRTR